MKTYATWKRETAYRTVRGQARVAARRARETTLVLTDGDRYQAKAAYTRALWDMTRQLLNKGGT